jgi:membrane-bound lytic murein transglycosylase D
VKITRATFISIIVFALLACSNTLHYTYPPPSESNALVVLDTIEQPVPTIQAPTETLQQQIQEEKTQESKPPIEQSQEEPIPVLKMPVEQKPQHDISFRVNPQVKSWINKLTVRDRENFVIDLARFDRVRPVMEDIFVRHGIPKELVSLCLVESGAKPHAVSCSGAVGYWQFLPDTAKLYGLQINKWVDERKNLEKSTEAAAHYLKHLYSIFDDWLLAIAAYNAGEGAIFRLVKSNGVNSFWDISHTMTIKPETLDYVPKFVATVMISKNREKYGLPKLEGSLPSNIHQTIDSPSYLDRVARTNDYFQESLQDSNTTLITESYSHPDRSSKPKDENITHKVRKGETLFSLAKKYSITVNTLAEANNISPKKKLSLGKTIIIPVDSPKEKKKVKSEQTTYTVAKGDTLESISKKYGSTVDDVKRLNNLKDPGMIQPKTVLAIPSIKKAIATVRTTQYKVKKGDTIWRISRQFDVSAMDIRRWNRLDTTAQIKPGDELTIYHR